MLCYSTHLGEDTNAFTERFLQGNVSLMYLHLDIDLPSKKKMIWPLICTRGERQRDGKNYYHFKRHNFKRPKKECPNIFLGIQMSIHMAKGFDVKKLVQ